MKNKDRLAEVYYYQWSVNRWRSSETRGILTLAGKGLYRELLDLCYAQGSIPKDFKILAAQVGCMPIEIEQVWPDIKRHFYADTHDSARLKNRSADMFRKEFFAYIDSQKHKGRTGGARKAKGIKDIASTGLSQYNTTNKDNTTNYCPQQFGDWEETGKAINEKYPGTDAAFVERLVLKCGKFYAQIENPKCQCSDRIIAEAVRQYKNAKQETAGLYLKTIPGIIAAWAKNGRPGSGSDYPIWEGYEVSK